MLRTTLESLEGYQLVYVDSSMHDTILMKFSVQVENEAKLKVACALFTKALISKCDLTSSPYCGIVRKMHRRKRLNPKNGKLGVHIRFVFGSSELEIFCQDVVVIESEVETRSCI